MTQTLRITLIICSIIALILCIKRTKESKLKIENSIIWIIGSIILIIMSIFYKIPEWLAVKLGFISPANFVFLVIIAFLLIQTFIDNLRLAELNEKIKNINHYIALKEHDKDKK